MTPNNPTSHAKDVINALKEKNIEFHGNRLDSWNRNQKLKCTDRRKSRKCMG